MSLLEDTPPTYTNVLHVLRETLASRGIDEPRRAAEWMLMEVVDASRAQLYAHGDRRVSEQKLTALEQMIERRSRSEPLQYIVGYTEFYGLRIEVSPAVLIPRPETERVVEKVLDCLETVDRPVVLDIGTGSGCIALALSHERPEARVVACDKSEAALRVARRNAHSLELSVEFLRADMETQQFTADLDEPFDAIVSNPPYVSPAERQVLPPEVRAYEPEEALFTPEDPLYFYRFVARKGLKLLRPGGWLVVETHADYGGKVADLLRRDGYVAVELYEDWADHPRVAVGRNPGPAER
jgi:release factor glutamine methyltransferase